MSSWEIAIQPGMPVGWDLSVPMTDAGIGRVQKRPQLFEDSPPSHNGLKDSEMCSPVRKRSRQSRAGKLDGFLSFLPHDVLFEV
jgi:hypothetical protein